MFSKYSVLMSVYYKEKPENLRDSIQSILDQTVQTDDFVLVCDGPLTDDLNSIIEIFKTGPFGSIFNICRLEVNSGLGNALNQGLLLCKNELVARMDSDDISLPDRCEKELCVFNANHRLSIVGGVIEEFDDTPNNIVSKKTVPENNDEILAYCKKRNPFNHPSVMFKKTDVISAGNYQPFYLLEDYYLWVRMLNKGYVGYNLQETIHLMRAGEAMYKRRGGIKYAKSFNKLLKFMYDSNMISRSFFYKWRFIRTVISLLPSFLRRFLYLRFARS